MTQPQARKLTLVLLAFALGGVLRLWFIHHAAVIAGDSFLYGDIALSWMQHGIYGFSRPPLLPIPTLIRLPGYPLFLMLCFRLFGPEHYTAVLNTEATLDLLACLLLAALARRLFGPRAALAALVLAALCPFTASYTAAVLTETLTLAAITAAFYALERWRSSIYVKGNRTATNPWLYLLAAALGYSILLRPEQGLLAAAILPAMLWITHRTQSVSLFQAAKPALVVALVTALPLVPWTIRNARTFHVFQPLAPRSATDPGDSQPRGFNLWYRTWGIDFASTEDVYWNYDGAPIQIADLPVRAFDSPAQRVETEDLISDYNRTAKPTPAFEASFTAIAKARIRSHPIRYYLGLPVARLVNMLLRPRIEMLDIPLAWWRWHEHPGKTAFSYAYASLNLAYLITGALGLARWIRSPATSSTPIAWSMIGFILLRCALLLTLDNSEPRYTLELFPILILGIASLFSNQKTPGARPEQSLSATSRINSQRRTASVDRPRSSSRPS